VLFGEVNPSGRLSMTVPKRLEDHPTYKSFAGTEDDGLVYDEGTEFGYRSYDSKGIVPAYREYCKAVQLCLADVSLQLSGSGYHTRPLTGGLDRSSAMEGTFSPSP
jgi:hypothetical protein